MTREKETIMRGMEGEWNSIQVLSCVLCAIIYTYHITLRLPKGFCRLLSAVPVIYTYQFLPWKNSSFHGRGILAFLFTWVSSFKLLMLCYEVGPLASPMVTSSLPHFIAMSAFPIKMTSTNPTKNPKSKISKLKHVLEICVLVTIIGSYRFVDRFPTALKLVLYGVHIYLFLDIMLVSLAALADYCLGADLEPQFNKPYLARSLEDFWGRRWNLIVTNILRPSVYDPVLHYCWNLHKNNSRDIVMKPPLWARGVAMLATFLVSGFMHELILYYLSESEIKGDMMGFFVLHGCCTAAEVWLKRLSWSPEMIFPEVVSIAVTLGFILVTASWLFFPKFVMNGLDVKGIGEYEILTRKMTTLFNSLIS